MSIINLTGGLDSTVLLYWALERDYPISAVFMNYGFPPNSAELKIVNSLAEKFQISHRTIDLTSLIHSLDLPPFNSIQYSLKHQALVEFLLSLSTFPGEDELLVGSIKREDTQSKDVHHILESLNARVSFPFSNMEKSDVVVLGTKLGVDFRETWSCLISGKIHCGFCEACLARKRAFMNAKVVDPTDYYYPHLVSREEKKDFLRKFLMPFAKYTGEYPDSIIENYNSIIIELNRRFGGVKP
jgi:7-cyano-7-deazaguanine synthase